MTTKNEDFSGDLSEYTQLYATAATIASGRLLGTAAASTGIFHSAGTYGNDQSASFRVHGVGGSYYYTALVRVVYTAAGNFDAYQGTIGRASGDTYLEKVTAGSGSELATPGSIGRALLDTDVIELVVVGTGLSLNLNGSPVLTASDGDFASGKPGVIMFSNGELDDAVFEDSGGGGGGITGKTHVDGIALSGISHLDGIAQSGLSDINRVIDRIRAIGSGWKRNSDGRLLVPAYPMG